MIAAEIIRNAEFDACIDDYIVDVDAAAEVEEINADNAHFATVKTRTNFVKNVFAKVGEKFSIKLARADEERNSHEDEDGLWSCRLTSKNVNDNDLYIFENDGKFLISVMIGLSDRIMAEYGTEEEAKRVIIALGAAVKRGEKVFTFPTPRKAIVSWDDVYKVESVGEIFRLQKDFKKFLKLGEMKLAENVFNNIKMIFKAA